MIYTSRCALCGQRMTLIDWQWVTDAGTEQETWKCGETQHRQGAEEF